MSKYRNPSAAYAIIVNDEKILLQKRKGSLSGYWDMAACGHIEEAESMKEALVRELYEEIGLDVSIENLNFVTMIHSYYDDYKYSYYNGYFLVEAYKGQPTIKELAEIEELSWFSFDNLPEKIYPDRLLAIECYKNNIPYSEFGWQEAKKR